MKMNTLLIVGSFCLVVFTDIAVAGGASAAAVGPGSVGGTASNAGGDSSGNVKKMNQYSVKSYTVMRQLLATAGTKDAPAAAAGTGENK